MRTEPAPIIQFVATPEACDCSIVALCGFLGLPYGEVAQAFRSRRVFAEGASIKQIQRAAAKLGTKLVVKADADPELDDGIQWLSYRDGGLCHVLVVREGFFFDGTEVWHPDDYLKAKDARLGPVLVRRDP
jgi:hypothetical protein